MIDRIGEAGKKLTGRSRNDQVALDMKLYTRDEINEIDGLLKDLLFTLNEIMNQHRYLYAWVYPSSKAQPVTLAHHMGAF